jgi:hypothetical protein
MRAPFVLQLDSHTHPAEHRVIRRIEKVDTGRELRIRSGDDLLRAFVNATSWRGSDGMTSVIGGPMSVSAGTRPEDPPRHAVCLPRRVERWDRLLRG